MSFMKQTLENSVFKIVAVNTNKTKQFSASIRASNPIEARINFISLMRIKKKMEPGVDYTFKTIRSEQL